MPDRNPTTDDAGSIGEHLGRAFHHLDQALRSYIALIAGRFGQAARTAAKAFGVALILGVVAVVGLCYAASGLARLLETKGVVPEGGGFFLVGILMIGGVLGALLLLRGKGEK